MKPHFPAIFALAVLLAACTNAAQAPSAPSQPSPQIQPPGPTTTSAPPEATISAATPVPTPAGEAIYFALRERLGEGYADLGVYRYDIEAANLAQVAPEGWNLQDVSADGSRLLLNQGSQLFAADAGGGNEDLVSDRFFDFGSRGAAWKPDGSGFVFIQTDLAGNTLVGVDTAGTQTELYAGVDAPIEITAVTPGGEVYWLAGSCTGEGVCTRGAVHRTAPGGGDSLLLDGFKAVNPSPAGNAIAFSFDNQEGKSSLGVSNPDLSARQALALPGDLLGQFGWSGDGTRIAAVRYDRSDYSGKVSGTRNFVVDPASGGVKELPESPGILGGIAFSPDGTRVLLYSSIQTNEGYEVQFKAVDSLTGQGGELPGLRLSASENFLLLTNLFWSGK